MASALIATLERELAKRRAGGLWRSRRIVESAQRARVVIDGRELVNFASNDYLGLASDPALVEAVRDAALRWGVGAAASHLVCGHQRPHESLEEELASYAAPCDGGRAIVFSSGYLANLAILATLADRGAAVFADRLNHACLNDGALLARAHLVRYPHGDVEALARRMEASTSATRIIATDAVFSMDGDVAPISELARLAERHDAWLVVDDAHGFGVLGEGRGTLAELRVRGERVVLMATLGKAAGVAGAFVTAHESVVESIVQRARPYIYTTAAPAMLACAASVALTLIRDGEPRRAHLRGLIARFRSAVARGGRPLGDSTTPIQPVIVGDNDAAVALSARLHERGFLVPAIRPPTVPAGTARLRVSLSAAHAEADVEALADALAV